MPIRRLLPRRVCSSALVGCLAALTVLAPATQGQVLGSEWKPTLGTGPSGTVYASTLFDFDGDGPEAPIPVIAIGWSNINAMRVLALRNNQWEPVGAYPFMFFGVLSLVSYDPDGPGPQPPQLIAAGHFNNINSTFPQRIARWDGTVWQPMASGFDDFVSALTVFDPDGDGVQPPQLIAGGRFTRRGNGVSGPGLSHIARWDGAAWQPLGNGLNDSVFALTVFDPDGSGPQLPQLIAGGNFSASGTVPASRLARWDGATWSPLGTGVNGGSSSFDFGNVSALSAYDPDGAGPQLPQLIAGGYFTASGTTALNHIGRWDGAAWQPMAGFSGNVLALTTYDPGTGPQLIVGGDHGSTATPSGCIARWDGAAWQVLGAGLNRAFRTFGGGVRTMLSYDPDGPGPQGTELLVAGDFAEDSGLTTNRVARWNGAAWSAGAGGINTTVNALTTFDLDGDGPQPPQLFAAASDANCVTRWDGTAWQLLPSWYGGAIALLAFYPDGTGTQPSQLIVGGYNLHPSGDYAGYAARWNGSAWEQLGSLFALNEYVNTFTAFDADGPGPLLPQLITGTAGNTGSGAPNRVYQWSGVSWLPLGGAMNNIVSAVVSFDPDADGPQPPQLIAAGSFTTIAAVTVNYVARWDGSAWQPMATGLNNTVNKLFVFDPDGSGSQLPQLIAGGTFTTPGGGGAALNRIARWDGAAWQPLGGGMSTSVSALGVYDPDGEGPRPPLLISGGTLVGGVSGRGLASWDGASWQSVGNGLDSSVSAIAPYTPPGSSPQQPRLVVGGAFTFAGALAMPHIAMLSPASSPADIGRQGGLVGPDGLLDNNDFIIYINWFFASDPRADLGSQGGVHGADGHFDNNDFIVFIDLFFAS